MRASERPGGAVGRQISAVAAAQVLAERDPVIGALFAAAGPPKLPARHDTHFAALVRSIVYQQLAGSAAAAIHRRLLEALDGEAAPEQVLAREPDALRAAGLSANKVAALRDLAAKALDGTVVLDPRGLAREPDEEIIARLSSVRGVGRWTAQMFLLFQLRRPDVWPSGDLGVRRGYGLAHDVPMPSPRALEELGARFRPYRSVAAWYCWRACERGAATGSAVVG